LGFLGCWPFCFVQKSASSVRILGFDKADDDVSPTQLGQITQRSAGAPPPASLSRTQKGTRRRLIPFFRRRRRILLLFRRPPEMAAAPAFTGNLKVSSSSFSSLFSLLRPS
jgi:hypothetical protein